MSGQKTEKDGQEEWKYTWGFGDNVPTKYKTNQRRTTDDTGFSNWAPGEPNEPRASEVEIFANDNKWGDHGGDASAFGKWNDSTNFVQGIIVEKINNASRARPTRYIIEKVGEQEYITDKNLLSIIWTFARLTYTQEFRSTLYHYGHDGYVNMTYIEDKLYENVGTLREYQEKWKNRNTVFPTGRFTEKLWSPYYRKVPNELNILDWQKRIEEKYTDYWPSIMEYKAMYGSINLE